MGRRRSLCRDQTRSMEVLRQRNAKGGLRRREMRMDEGTWEGFGGLAYNSKHYTQQVKKKKTGG